MPKTKENRKRRKFLKFILWMVLTVFVILGGVTAWAYFFAQEYVNELMSDYVYHKTGTYRLTFDHIEFSSKNWELEIKEVNFIPDSAVYYELKTHNREETQLINIYSPSLKIKNFRLKPLLKDRKVVIRNININAPEFSLMGENKEEKPDSARIDPAEIKAAILKYVNGIHIHNFEISDASYDFYELLGQSGQFNGQAKATIQLENFILAPEIPDSRYELFDVSDIRLKLENYSLALKDSIHTFHADELNFSLIKSSITGNQISLKPAPNTKNRHQTRYFVDIPDILIHSENIAELYGSDSLVVNRLALNNPKIQIRVKEKTKNPSTKTQLQLDLYELIKNDFSMAAIDSFEINEADIRLYTYEKKTPGQQLDGFTFQLYDFKLDAQSGYDKNRILYAQNGIIQIRDFTLNHADSIHQLKANNFWFDTRQKIIQTGAISFLPRKGRYNPNEILLKVRSKSIDMRGVDIKTAFHEKMLNMQMLGINQPNIELSRTRPKTVQPQKAEKSIILDKIKGYLLGIYVDDLTIDKGFTTLNYLDKKNKSGFFSTTFNFKLGDVSLDENTFYRSDKMFMANRFQVVFSDIKLQLADNVHKLKLDEFNLSSHNQSATLKNFHLLTNERKKAAATLSSMNKNQIFDIQIPSIRLSGANFHKAFFDKELSIKQFAIDKPKIDIELITGHTPSTRREKEKLKKNELFDLISKYVFSIELNQFKVENGDLHVVHQGKSGDEIDMSNRFDVKLSDFLLNKTTIDAKNRILFSKNVDLVLRDYTISLSDDVHKFNSEEIGILTSEKRAYVLNARLYPDITSPSFEEMKVTFKAEVPRLDLKNADFIRAINYRDLQLDQFLFTTPNIEIFVRKKENKKEVQKEPFLVPEDIKHLLVNNFIIKKGTLNIFDYTNLNKDLITRSNIDFRLEGLNVDVNAQQKANTSYTNFDLNLNNPLINLQDSIHEILAQNIHLNKNRQVFEATGLHMQPKGKLTTPNKTLYNITIPNLRLTGFDYPRMIKKQELICRALDIDQPNIEITPSGTKSNRKFSPFKPQLYDKVKSIASSFNINDIQVNGATLDLKSKKPFELSNIDLSLKHFLLDENSEKTGKFFYSDYTTFDVYDFEGKNKAGHYNYKLDHFFIDSKGDFNLSNFRYQPNLSKDAYYKIKQSQEDYATIRASSIRGNIELNKVFKEDYYHLPNLMGNIELVDIYRDKRYPFPKDRYTKLPQQIAREMKKTFSIDTINLYLKELAYKEMIEGARKASMVNFTKVNLFATNYTNDKELLKQNKYTKARLDGYLMNKSRLKAIMLFDIPSPDNQLTFSANLDSFLLQDINPMSEPSMKLSVKDGYTTEFNIKFNATENNSSGELRFGYQDLKISVLKDRKGKIKEEKFISFLANSLLLKSKNPRKGKELEPVQFTAKRDKQKSVVNYIWVNTFSGLKQVLGLKDKEEKENTESK